MMNQLNQMNHKQTLIASGMCVLASAVLATSPGCSKHEEETVAVAPPPPPPPAPEAPKVTPIDQLMAQLNIDPKVHLPEAKAPDNDEDRKAVLVFFDSFARGNAQALKTM